MRIIGPRRPTRANARRALARFNLVTTINLESLRSLPQPRTIHTPTSQAAPLWPMLSKRLTSNR